jgi:hypothetical protein
MTDLDFWWRTNTIIAAIAAIGQTVFILLYLFFPWYKSFLGRALFYKAIVLGLLLNVVAVGIAFNWPFEDESIIVLMGLVSTGIWAQNAAFIKVRAQGRQHDLGDERPMSNETPAQLTVEKDARNRAFRTLLQGLAFDVGAALAIVLYTAFVAAEGWGDIQWALLGFTLAKTFTVSALSYLMRTVFRTVAPPPAPVQPPSPSEYY